MGMKKESRYLPVQLRPPDTHDTRRNFVILSAEAEVFLEVEVAVYGNCIVNLVSGVEQRFA